MKPLLLLLALPTVVWANDNCVLQDRTVTRNTAVIAERSTINRDVVPWFGDKKKCIVDFRARVGSQWHTAFGEYIWNGHTPAADACAKAVAQADEDLRNRVGRSQSISEKILVCKDRPSLNTISGSQIGTVGDVGQFRPHPEYTGRFHHNGTQCKWFIETAFVERDVRTFQGIICEVQKGRWAVVDKF